MTQENITQLIILIIGILITIISLILNVIQKKKSGQKVDIILLLEIVKEEMKKVENISMDGSIKKMVVESSIPKRLEENGLKCITTNTISNLIEEMIDISKTFNNQNEKEEEKNEIRWLSNTRFGK